MNETTETKTHWSFWVISVFMLVWYAMGSANFIVQMNSDAISSYRDSEQAIIMGRPLWATVGFALSVFGGAIGCVLLMLRKRVAFYLFVASLIGTLLAVGHSMSIGIEFSAGETVGIIALPIILSVFLVWYSNHVMRKSWY